MSKTLKIHVELDCTYLLTKCILLPFLMVLAMPVFSQNMVKLSLNQSVELAIKNSLDDKIITNQIQSSHWNFQAFKSSFLPKLSVSGSMPEYYRSINAITLPTGRNDFVIQHIGNAGVNFNLTEQIGLTGGSLSIGSSLRRIDNFGNVRSSAYTAVPLTLSYFQENLFYNGFKWRKAIEPLKFQEAKRGYIENLQEIAHKLSGLYFEYLLADIRVKLDQQNLKNIDTLVKITSARFEIGTVQLNDILQSKVSLLNARKSAANSDLSLQLAKQNFVRYLGLDNNTTVQLATPDSVAFFKIQPEVAFEKAKENRKFFVEFTRRRLEAEQDIEYVKTQTGPKINALVNVGLTQRGNNITESYNDLLRNQSLILGFYIPLVDWGVNRSNRKRAEANLELELNTIKQQELAIEQEIFYQVYKWNIQQSQMQIAQETKELAERRYDLARQRYATGSLSFTDFNNSQLEKDRAVIDYITNLYQYWSAFYLMRRLTLFDFQSNRPIDFPDHVFK